MKFKKIFNIIILALIIPCIGSSNDLPNDEDNLTCENLVGICSVLTKIKTVSHCSGLSNCAEVMSKNIEAVGSFISIGIALSDLASSHKLGEDVTQKFTFAKMSIQSPPDLHAWGDKFLIFLMGRYLELREQCNRFSIYENQIIYLKP